jgi:FixJ family two-component response regulator
MNEPASTRSTDCDRSVVIVVDDDANMRSALLRLLRSSGSAVELFASGAELLAHADLTRAGCLLIDVHMPDMGGLELQSCLAARGVRLPVVFLTGSSDIPIAVAAMRNGAVDFIEKPFDDEDLVARVRRAIDGNRDQRHEQDRCRDILRRLRTLTPRECGVLDLVVSGKTSKEIARSLGSSHRTIEVHRRNLMEKMDAPTLADLVRMRLSTGTPGVGH